MNEALIAGIAVAAVTDSDKVFVDVFPQMIRLNARWRVTVIRSGVSQRPAWMLEELVDDAWQARAMLRGAAMLREMIRARCGRLLPGVAAVLAGLPKRVDIDIDWAAR
jgi:hypothetical protein